MDKYYNAGYSSDGDYYKTEDVERIKGLAFELETEIDGLLCEGGSENYRKCCEIIEDKRLDYLFNVSRKLMVLRILANIESNQLNKNNEITVFSNRNLEKLENVYQEMVFRLRRVEFGMDIDIKQDILQFLIQEQLSLDFLLGVLAGTVYLYSKNFIWESISRGLGYE